MNVRGFCLRLSEDSAAAMVVLSCYCDRLDMNVRCRPVSPDSAMNLAGDAAVETIVFHTSSEINEPVVELVVPWEALFRDSEKEEP